LSLSHQELPSVRHLEQAFFYVLFYLHPFSEMFIVSGKTHCCNDACTDVQVTSLLAEYI